MKKSPQQQKLEAVLRSSKISGPGFLGNDTRSIFEIIDADGAELATLGRTQHEVAARMEELTQRASAGLGAWVAVSAKLRVSVDDTRGMIPCPWPHHARCPKRVTTVVHGTTGKRISWSELNVHLIREHGFFEGRGSPFRLEPRELIEIVFD